MARYIPTYDGRGIVTIFEDDTCGAWIRSIPEAEEHLQQQRKDAWDASIRPGASGILANHFLALSNSLSDALSFASELRGESEKRRAA